MMMKKAVFLFISGLLFTSLLAFAQAIPKMPTKLQPKGPLPGTVKPLPPIAIKPGILGKKIIFQLGDWNSSGSPEAPYVPSYPYQYQCQAQITDSVDRRQAGESYRYFVIADFELNETTNSVDSDSLQWVGQKFFSTSKISETDEPVPFDYKGQSISLTMKPRENPSNDLVILYGELSQKVGPLIFSSRDHYMATRESSHLSLTVSLDIRNTQDPQYPRMMMRILCDKLK